MHQDKFALQKQKRLGYHYKSIVFHNANVNSSIHTNNMRILVHIS